MSKRHILILLICIALAGCTGILLLQNRAEDQIQPKSTIPPAQPTPSPEATAPAIRHEGDFELPLEGATGYATIPLNLRSAPDASSDKLGSFAPGDGFRILGQSGDFWQVSDGTRTGYVAHRYCMVNLPDIIPSIVYDNTNSYDSQILSSGKAVPGITGEGLYENTAYNPRLGEETFIMPTLYAMAPKIQAAQRAAMQDGNSLKIYEAYRPHQVQRKVVDAMAQLAGRDEQVRAGISTPPWKISWFVSQGTSNHQRGCAIDVSLVEVVRTQERTSGSYAYDVVTEYNEYQMPTPIHELSIAAAAFSQPVSSSSVTAWKSAILASGMNNAARALQAYCTEAGLTPLASEWWHFNDLGTHAQVGSDAGRGEFILQKLYSVSPDATPSQAYKTASTDVEAVFIIPRKSNE